MTYWQELRTYWLAILAGAIGLGSGLSLQTYILPIFVPQLMAEFAWTKAQYAVIGYTASAAILTMPVAGRIVDLLGVRRTILVGALGTPVAFLLFSFMTGTITQYFLLSCVVLAVGALTTSSIYSRLVVGCFNQARGTALALMICGPALVALVGTPLLTSVITEHGWRVGYYALAAFSATGGIIALLLAPRTGEVAPTARQGKSLRRRILDDYPVIFRQTPFWLIVGGMVLCNVPQVLISYHMPLVLGEQGASAAEVALILSAFATSVIIGRFVCGFSLDRFPAHIVAAIAMVIPAIGYFILASHIDSLQALYLAVALMGLSQGAESDIGAYLVARHFSLKIYGSVFGLILCSLSVTTVFTTMMLTRMLGATESYAMFCTLSGIAVIIGSLLFLLLKSAPPFAAGAVEDIEPILQPAGA